MSDSEYEEESSYVVFDPGNSITPEFLDTAIHTSGGCRIIGLEEGEPYLQIGDVICKGEVDETVGTHLIFEIEERKTATTGLLPLLASMRSNSDEGPKQRYTVKYACSTENIITFDVVTLKKKDDETIASQEKVAQNQNEIDNDVIADDNKLDSFIFGHE